MISLNEYILKRKKKEKKCPWNNYGKILQIFKKKKF